MIRRPMRAPILAGLVLALFLAVYNAAILGKERLLASGETMILALAPVDPRSLMQGDYMILNIAEGRAMTRDAGDGDGPGGRERTAVMAPDETGLWTYRRLDRGETLDARERRLIFRPQGDGSAKIAGGSWFFEEGQGAAYARARFAELRVAPDGTALIAALLDADRNRLSAAGQRRPD